MKWSWMSFHILPVALVAIISSPWIDRHCVTTLGRAPTVIADALSLSYLYVSRYCAGSALTDNACLLATLGAEDGEPRLEMAGVADHPDGWHAMVIRKRRAAR
jgi:hypothetical protein